MLALKPTRVYSEKKKKFQPVRMNLKKNISTKLSESEIFCHIIGTQIQMK